jgi:hypothetical protein
MSVNESGKQIASLRFYHHVVRLRLDDANGLDAVVADSEICLAWHATGAINDRSASKNGTSTAHLSRPRVLCSRIERPANVEWAPTALKLRPVSRPWVR